MLLVNRSPGELQLIFSFANIEWDGTVSMFSKLQRNACCESEKVSLSNLIHRTFAELLWKVFFIFVLFFGCATKIDDKRCEISTSLSLNRGIIFLFSRKSLSYRKECLNNYRWFVGFFVLMIPSLDVIHLKSSTLTEKGKGRFCCRWKKSRREIEIEMRSHIEQWNFLWWSEECFDLRWCCVIGAWWREGGFGSAKAPERDWWRGRGADGRGKEIGNWKVPWDSHEL